MGAEAVIALAAAVIALAALFVAIFEVRATRRHNRLSVRPVLQCRVTLREGEPSGLSITNAGLGPAVIVETRVWLDGVLMGPWNRECTIEVIKRLKKQPTTSTLVEGSTLSPGTQKLLLGLSSYMPSENPDFKTLLETRLDLEVRYESLYGGENLMVTTRSPGWRSQP
ncbi:hypothetical protein [Nonomuraea sp. NPDC049646]|uniref:hypothetical protein n=1 Tax=unclassified Nonomuraea TaxID=2593643 RepID=UPI0037A43D09